MNKKKIPTQQEIEDGSIELTAGQIRELKSSVADSENPVRYAIFADIIGNGKWRLWLDVSLDGYGMSIDQATLFKREHIARAVAKAYSKDRKRALLIAKITTKGGKRRVLKYEKPEHRITKADASVADRQRQQ